jgi:hypothetical protein
MPVQPLRFTCSQPAPATCTTTSDPAEQRGGRENGWSGAAARISRLDRGLFPRHEPWIRLASAPARRVCPHKSTNIGAFSLIGLHMRTCANERDRLRTRTGRNSAAAPRSSSSSGRGYPQVKVVAYHMLRSLGSISTTYCASRPVAMPDLTASPGATSAGGGSAVRDCRYLTNARADSPFS